MPEPQLPNQQPLDRDARALRALSIAGRSPVLLRSLADEYRDRLAALVDQQGQGTSGSQHGEMVRLVLVDHYESKKASVDEGDFPETTNQPETPDAT